MLDQKYYFIAGSGNKKSFYKKNLKKISKSLKKNKKNIQYFYVAEILLYSNKLSFSITSVRFFKKIIYRNNAKLNDDIYVTGNLGDSFVGLKILKKN